MNAQMRLVIMLTSVAVSGSLLFAAEPAPTRKPPAQPAPAEASAEQPGEQEAAKAPKADEAKKTDEEARAAAPAEDEDPEPKRAASPADKAGSPQRFNPSEQVRADFDVSFPIDI